MKKQIALLLTTRCNFQCKHCLRGYPTEHFDAPLDVLKKTFSEAKDLGFKHIGLTGGEPILHPEFGELIKMLVDMGYTWSVTSNGSFPQEYGHYFTKFKDSLSLVRLSLDGGTPDTHDYIRQNGSFDTVIQSAQYYKELGRKLFFSFGLNARSINEIEDFFQIAKNAEVNGVTIGAIIPTEYNQELGLKWADKVRAYAKIDKIKADLPFKVLTASCLFSFSDPDAFCGNINTHKPAINAHGDYIFCCDNLGDGAVIGSLREESFNDLYKKGKKTALWLKEKRKEMIKERNFFQDFNSCNFCNTLLKDMII